MAPTKSHRKRKFDENVIKTERDTRRATGEEDENDFEEEEPPLKMPSVYGFSTIRDVLVRKNIQRRIREREGKDKEKDQFPFMKLPSEIRNMIYRYLVISNATRQVGLLNRTGSDLEIRTQTPTLEKDPISLGNDYWPRTYSSKYWKSGGIEVAILGVNRQVYSETSRILYTENQFVVNVNSRLGQTCDYLNYRVDVMETRALATRSLRSGRKIDMLQHVGLIYPHVVHRLRNLDIAVEIPSFPPYSANPAPLLPSRTCFHEELFFYQGLGKLVDLFVTRAKEASQMDDLSVQGKKWAFKIKCDGKIGLVSLSIMVQAFMRKDFLEVLRDGKASIRIEGQMPFGWKKVMNKLGENGATEGTITNYRAAPEDYFEAVRVLAFFRSHQGPILRRSIIYDEESERLGLPRCDGCAHFHEDGAGYYIDDSDSD